MNAQLAKRMEEIEEEAEEISLAEIRQRIERITRRAIKRKEDENGKFRKSNISNRPQRIRGG